MDVEATGMPNGKDRARRCQRSVGKLGELDRGLVKRSTAQVLLFMKYMMERPPVDSTWVDVTKGSARPPDVRCRLVASDFEPRGEKDRVGLFAAMPPLEAKKL